MDELGEEPRAEEIAVDAARRPPSRATELDMLDAAFDDMVSPDGSERGAGGGARRSRVAEDDARALDRRCAEAGRGRAGLAGHDDGEDGDRASCRRCAAADARAAPIPPTPATPPRPRDRRLPRAAATPASTSRATPPRAGDVRGGRGRAAQPARPGGRAARAPSTTPQPDELRGEPRPGAGDRARDASRRSWRRPGARRQERQGGLRPARRRSTRRTRRSSGSRASSTRRTRRLVELQETRASQLEQQAHETSGRDRPARRADQDADDQGGSADRGAQEGGPAAHPAPRRRPAAPGAKLTRCRPSWSRSRPGGPALDAELERAARRAVRAEAEAEQRLEERLADCVRELSGEERARRARAATSERDGPLRAGDGPARAGRRPRTELEHARPPPPPRRPRALRKRIGELEETAARNEERVTKLYTRIKADEKLREKTKKALGIAQQLLEEASRRRADDEEAVAEAAA